jgi:hypothetical protein
VTVALCLNCGSTKWGAFCPCPACQVDSTGNHSLDITFSDHRLSHATLEQLGAVVRAIATRTADRELRLLAFMRYVSTRHPDILTLNLKPPDQERADAVLAGLAIPPVEVRPPPGLNWRTLLALAALAASVWWFFLRG